MPRTAPLAAADAARPVPAVPARTPTTTGSGNGR